MLSTNSRMRSPTRRHHHHHHHRSDITDLVLKVFLCLAAITMIVTILSWIYLPAHDLYPKYHPMDNLLLARGDDSSSSSSHTTTNRGKKKHEQEEESATPNYHMVFSTSCSASQDWQSYVFFYSAMKVNQPGDVTRIASGCTEDEQRALTKLHDEQISIMSHRFHVHFAPACTDKRSKYFNKPFGLLDYMERNLGYPDTKEQHDDDIIMIVDPDMMLLRPLTHVFDLEKTDWVVPDPSNSAIVTHGHPISQAYGFGSSWIESIRDNATYVIAESPALHVDKQTAAHYYPSGPPYLATARDMYQIVVHWTKFVVRIHDIFPHFMSEMHAYSFASAHLQLPHQLARSFMVSDVDVEKAEGWGFLRDVKRENVCNPDAGVPVTDLPYVFHYCQRYALGRWFMGKYKIPKNTFQCDAPMFREPPPDVAIKYDWFIYPNQKDIQNFAHRPFKVLQNTWSMCRLITSLNEVLTNYKTKHCDAKVANFNKSFIFHKEDDFNAFLQGEIPELPPA